MPESSSATCVQRPPPATTKDQRQLGTTQDDRVATLLRLHASPNALEAGGGFLAPSSEDERITAELRAGTYLAPTADVVRKHGGLWFQDESFVVVRRSAGVAP